MENYDSQVVKEAFKGLKEEGFSVQSFPPTFRGDTLLHRACFFGSPSTIKKLLALGADKKAKNKQGWTASRVLKWRVSTYGMRGVSYDEEVLELMDVNPPFIFRAKRFFKKFLDF